MRGMGRCLTRAQQKEYDTSVCGGGGTLRTCCLAVTERIHFVSVVEQGAHVQERDYERAVPLRIGLWVQQV